MSQDISDWVDMMADTVTIYRWLSQSATAVPTYSSTGTTYLCHINMMNHLIVNAEGREILAKGSVILNTTDSISVKDKIVLPSDYVPVSPPILAVNIYTDEIGNHHATLEIG